MEQLREVEDQTSEQHSTRFIPAIPENNSDSDSEQVVVFLPPKSSAEPAFMSSLSSRYEVENGGDVVGLFSQHNNNSSTGSVLPTTQEVAEEEDSVDSAPVDPASLANASAEAAGVAGPRHHHHRNRNGDGQQRDFRSSTEALDRFAHFTIKKQTSYR